ncbi:hypothetical protein NVV93_09660 [Pseudomonas sp. LS44]|uniref:hypothetical protein n=1 Tax=Pseudomonas sp. LS44 TaxID=1357074 RepID=UPI00215B6BDF|nr:hypothetical protein [Pseudomonas sp. LS44]UVE19609.1 hypothetical protein NVV93_09660 [Pseudomonas sp. LS44]
MLKSLITALAKSLRRPAPSLGYQTRIYPSLGEMIVVYDSLDFGSLATDDQLSRMAAYWKIDEPFDTPIGSPNCSAPLLGDCSGFEINPGSGIPMICNSLDAMGNPFGWSDTNAETNI